MSFTDVDVLFQWAQGSGTMDLAWYCREQGLTIDHCSFGSLQSTFRLQSAKTMPVGSVEFVSEALAQLGVERPRPIPTPESLQRRQVQQMPLSQARWVAARSPLFVKPADVVKLFTGAVFTEATVGKLYRFPGDTQVLTAAPVEFVAEWRGYYVNGIRVGLWQYLPGDTLLPVPSDEEMKTVDEVAATLPYAGFSVDVGRLDTGELDVVELNDGWALGDYGLAPQDYYALMRSRWRQLTENAHLTVQR